MMFELNIKESGSPLDVSFSDYDHDLDFESQLWEEDLMSANLQALFLPSKEEARKFGQILHKTIESH